MILLQLIIYTTQKTVQTHKYNTIHYQLLIQTIYLFTYFPIDQIWPQVNYLILNNELQLNQSTQSHQQPTNNNQKNLIQNNNWITRNPISQLQSYLSQQKNNYQLDTQMKLRNQSDQLQMRILLAINCVLFVGHMYYDDADIWYFCQLTVIGQTMVILNFYLSILLHQDKCHLHTQLFLSRFHLITLALEAIIVIGFWSLRVFFPKGIVEDEERNFIIEFLSVWVHGGSFGTMFYFVKKDQILTQTQKRKKLIFHLLWAIPFCFIQYFRFYFTGHHIYGFIRYFTWTQLLVFEISLFAVAISVDYFISVRHGFKLLKNMEQHGGSRSHIHVKFD